MGAARDWREITALRHVALDLGSRLCALRRDILDDLPVEQGNPDLRLLLVGIATAITGVGSAHKAASKLHVLSGRETRALAVFRLWFANSMASHWLTYGHRWLEGLPAGRWRAAA